MKKSTELFQLIKSLSISEKRYFKLSVSIQKGEKNYIKLFNAIDKQNEYDEKAIIKTFEKENFIRQISVTKYNLCKLVLKSLRAYHSATTIDIELNELLHEVKILYTKGLFSHCKNMLKKAKYIAYKHENHVRILEVLNWEKDLMRAETYSGKKNKDIDNLLSEEKRIIDEYKNQCEFSCLDSKIFVLQLNNLYIRSEEELQEYEVIINDQLYRSERNALSYHAKIYFHRAHGFYFLSKSDFVDSYKHYHKLLELMDSQPLHLKENLRNYLSALHNIAVVLIYLKRYDEFKHYINKLRAISENHAKELSEDTRFRIFIRSYNMEYFMYILRGEFETCKVLINKIESGLQQFKRRVDKVSELSLIYKYSYAYFGCGEYSRSLHWLNKILNDPNPELASDIHCFARIMNLILHFELGNRDLLEYIVKSTYRYLYKRKHLYKFENSVLNFIRGKLPKIITQEELLDGFKELKKELEVITENSFERKVLEYFDFNSWLESKIENRLFAEIVRKKVSNAPVFRNP